jgi:hypothetical protein
MRESEELEIGFHFRVLHLGLAAAIHFAAD